MSYAINVPVATIGQATTCLACGIRLPSLETQQLHHKSDWHTYNLKRKMVNLPPVASEVFSQLVTASREQSNPEEVDQPECVPCGKKYLSFQAYENHLNSKKHKQTVVAYEKSQQQKEARLAQGDAAPSSKSSGATNAAATEQLEPSETVCLFCSHDAADATKNYEHMRSVHGFFLPSFERLIDLPGILAYLADKLVENYDCLWCTPSVFSQNLRPDQELNGGFATLASVRRHMNDKGHCKLAMDQGAEREYADFYLPLDDSDDEESAHRESLDDSSMDADTLDDDQQRLNSVLLDDEGNWIVDAENASASGIRIDPITNELVLNNRRLAHKDAARRQRVESRTVTLSSRSNTRPTASSSEVDGTSAEGDQTEDSETVNDPHHQDVKMSSALLKSQNQLSGSTLAVSTVQLNQVALKNARAQNFESTKRERMATKMGTNNNYSARARCDAPWGTKV
ncbi:hypothetical protein BGZ99_006608 [Dissophora globulifera]|uniref:Uncharacterized protein n=1 Tax=Dissophora globulifera TaxID=979702 RepID=A0A9P6URV7_9FUNG|nr:hypothetical protein BGZ99_006608 [Dissophora globulifera]